MTDWTVHQGDALSVLRGMDAGSVACVVTSPPYWKLRSYLSADDLLKGRELGGEKTVAEYIANLVTIFAEVKRVA